MKKNTNRRSHYNDDETIVCGLNSTLAVFRARSEDIIKLYFSERRKHDVSDIVRWCAANRRAYRVVAEEELERISDSKHHEGVCLISRSLPEVSLEQLLENLRSRERVVLLIMEDVQNPHNVGALLRTAAHFGCRGIIICGTRGAALSSAAIRVAEGGAESVPVIRGGDVVAAIAEIKKAGFSVIGTSPRARSNLLQSRLPERCAFLLGSEGDGVSREARAAVNIDFSIPGTGLVESLNVSAAGSVLLAEFFRQGIAVQETLAQDMPSRRNRADGNRGARSFQRRGPRDNGSGRGGARNSGPAGKSGSRSGGNSRKKDR